MEEEPGGWSGSAARQLCGLGPPCVSFPRPLPHGERGLARPPRGPDNSWSWSLGCYGEDPAADGSHHPKKVRLLKPT